MDALLSERLRPVVLPLAVAVLVSLCGYWIHLNLDGQMGVARLMKRSQEHHGEAVVLSLVTVGALFDDRYEVEEGTLTLTVLGPTDDLVPGREITVVGTWDAEQDAVVAREVHEAHGRPAKKRLGLLGLALTGLLVPAWFRLGPDGVRLRG